VKVGILGGTFDPIHDGHVAVAHAALECAGLDKVLLVPAGHPPHRAPADAPAADRLAMCRLVAAADPRLEAWDAEVRRQGPSYTVDTLREFARRRPGDEAFLILGWDAAREIRSWREPDAVLRIARLVVIARPGLPAPDASALRSAGLDPDRVILCPEATPDIAATGIRERLADGADLDGLVPAPVAHYIAEHRLYAG
jgi:nicotinate-nucleotide adenylyltransferase